MTRDALISLLASRDPLAAVRAFGLTPPRRVTVVAPSLGDGKLVDPSTEGPLDVHRAAHAQGRPSEAVVVYGREVGDDAVADRLLGLAALSEETGLLAAVTPVPADGTAERPGSWGVEDLIVIAAARGMVRGAAIRPSWEHLGAPTAQVALAFGATEWCVPEDDDTDLDRLAAAVGCTVERA